MGVLGLGFLVNFVSGPVSSGFTSAVALMIATSQVKVNAAVTKLMNVMFLCRISNSMTISL